MRTLQRMLAAVRAFRLHPHCNPYDQTRDYDEAEERRCREHPFVFVCIRQCIALHRTVKDAADRLHAGCHCRIPVAFFQVGQHFDCLNALAQGIRQCAFKSVAGVELYAALPDVEQHHQSVVLPLLPYAPRVEQLMAEVEAVGIAYRRHHGNDCLDAGLLLESVEPRVDAVTGCCGEDARRVADVTGLVREMHLGQIVRRVDRLCKRAHGQEACNHHDENRRTHSSCVTLEHFQQM